MKKLTTKQRRQKERRLLRKTEKRLLGKSPEEEIRAFFESLKGHIDGPFFKGIDYGYGDGTVIVRASVPLKYVSMSFTIGEKVKIE
jgi:hypothetical protein